MRTSGGRLSTAALNTPDSFRILLTVSESSSAWWRCTRRTSKFPTGRPHWRAANIVQMTEKVLLTWSQLEKLIFEVLYDMIHLADKV